MPSPPKAVYILIPEACEYVILRSRKGFADKRKDLEWRDSPGSPRLPLSNYKGPYERGRRVRVREGVMMEGEA